MTCNPFSSSASRYSVDAIEKESLRLFGDFDSSAVNDFPPEKLRKATECVNNLFRSLDLSRFGTLGEKLEQAPINSAELAEYLREAYLTPDDMLLLCENTRRQQGKSVKVSGTIRSVQVVSYPSDIEPGIYTKVTSKVSNQPANITGNLKGNIKADGSFIGTVTNANDQIQEFDRYEVFGYGTGIKNMNGTFRIDGVLEQLQGVSIGIEASILGGTYNPGFMVANAFLSSKTNGSGATFNVVVPNNGAPIVTIANPGSGYNAGTQVEIDDLGVIVQVQDTTSIFNINDNDTEIPTRTPIQNAANLAADFDIFLNDNYGSSITSGSCGGGFMSFIQDALNIFNQLQQYQVQIASLMDIFNNLGNIGDLVQGLVAGALQGLVNSLLSIVDNLVAQALDRIAGIRSNLQGVGQAFNLISRTIGDVERFFEENNVNGIRSLIEALVNNLGNQFEQLTPEIISWILMRFCQMSDFLSNFLQAPVQHLTDLVSGAQGAGSFFENISNESLATAVDGGIIRLDRAGLLAQVNAAAERSNAAGGSGGSGGTGGTGNVAPVQNAPAATRITAHPISEEDLAAVRANVTEAGWPGYFTWRDSVKNNNFGTDGIENYPGAGWRVVVNQNPAILAKLKHIAEQMGQSFAITSAYRHHNYHLARGIRSSPTSQHCSANALDVVMNASQAVRFIPLASANGFGGISFYPGSGFTHIDLAGRRTWGDGGSPAVRDVIRNHINGNYSR